MSTPASNQLGYHPRPELAFWLGTPIPPVSHPLQTTPHRWAIARRIWWHGPPWTVLRNGSYYLWHVWDYGLDDDIDFARQDIPIERWRRALDDARPGLVSRSAYVLWSIVLGRMSDNRECDWPRTAHIRDCKPLSGQDRETMYRRAAAAHAAREQPF